MSTRKFPEPLHLGAASSPVRDGHPVAVPAEELLANRNDMRNNRFVFTAAGIPQLPYFVTSTNIPGLNLGEFRLPTPMTDFPVPGDKIMFEPLVIRYKVDERLETFLGLQRWMRGLAFPESHKEHEALTRSMPKGVMDCGVSFRTNLGDLEGFFVHYKNCWPTALEGVDFDSADGQVPVTSTATLVYSSYDIYAVPDGQPMEKLTE